MDDSHKPLIEMCRATSTSLASVCYKIRPRGMDGAPLNLECREFIANTLVKRIEEKVAAWRLRSLTQLSACTVIPYFDINYLAVANILKLTERSDEQPQPMTDLRRSELVMTDSTSISGQDSLEERQHIPVALPRKFLRKSSLRASFDLGGDPMSVTRATTADATGLPSWVSADAIDDPDDFRHSRSMTLGCSPALLCKAGSSITLGNVSILFRLGKDLKPREKFKNTGIFDQQLSSFKQLFGLKHIERSITELSNQSLSRLVYQFNLSETQQAAVQTTQIEVSRQVVHPEQVPVELKTTWVMSYLEQADWGPLFPESLFVTQHMLSLFFKLIPEYITNLGLRLLYSKVRDGTSYQR